MRFLDCWLRPKPIYLGKWEGARRPSGENMASQYRSIGARLLKFEVEEFTDFDGRETRSDTPDRRRESFVTPGLL
jgi:hypothetical protein